MLVAVTILFAISGGILWLVGYNYDGLTGGAATKIHPSTYLMVLLFAWSLIASGQPIKRALHLMNRRPSAIVMFAVSITVILVTAASGGPGLAASSTPFWPARCS